MHSGTQALIHLLMITDRLTQSLTHPITHSCPISNDHLPTHSLIHSLILSTHSLTHSLTYSWLTTPEVHTLSLQGYAYVLVQQYLPCWNTFWNWQPKLVGILVSFLLYSYSSTLNNTQLQRCADLDRAIVHIKNHSVCIYILSPRPPSQFHLSCTYIITEIWDSTTSEDVFLLKLDV